MINTEDLSSTKDLSAGVSIYVYITSNTMHCIPLQYDFQFSACGSSLLPQQVT